MAILLNSPVAPCTQKLTEYLDRIHASGWYTNFGPLHQELTARLESYLGIENLLLVSNGTIALHVAYRALDIKSALCTPFSFAATATSLSWEKIPFRFIDIDEKSLNLSAALVEKNLEETGYIDSVVATHVYGNPCDVERFEKLREKYKIKLIYDGAHSFGVRYREQSLLKYGDATTLSFHATKVFHTLEGGAVAFRDHEVYERAKSIINFGLEDGIPTRLGINGKLNEYQAAVGLTLLDTIDQNLEHRRDLFELYGKSLAGYVRFPAWSENTTLNGSYLPIILKTEKEKGLIKAALDSSGIPCREYFSPSLNTVFNPQDSCPISESISKRILCLPLHFYLTRDNVTYIAKTVKEAQI